LAVKIKLNLPLQKLAGNRESVQTHGSSVRQCLDDLIKQIPGSEHLIFDEHGSPTILFLLNNEPLPGQDLDRAVKDNDELWLLSIVSGG
jgi:molybdopterin converting factor small subunit